MYPHRLPRSPYLVLLLLVGAAGASQAQVLALGPEAFALPAQFSSAAPTSTRQLALGAVIGSMNDAQFANPAFAPLRDEANAGVRLISTDFDAGPRLRSVQVHYARPLRPHRSGFQISWVDLSTCQCSLTLPQLGPVSLKMAERAWVVDYGRRVGAKSTAGLSVLGYHRVNFALTPAVGPPLLDLEAKADFGGRFGAAYEYLPGDFLGILYSFAQHTVDANGMLLGGPPRSPVYKDDLLSVGMSYHPLPRLLTVGEFHHGTLRRGSLLQPTNAWHVGAEYMVTPCLALRVGKTDARLTYGAGFARGRWRADYAHIQDWNDSSVRQLLGGSDTDSLQALYAW